MSAAGGCLAATVSGRTSILLGKHWTMRWMAKGGSWGRTSGVLLHMGIVSLLYLSTVENVQRERQGSASAALVFS